MSKRTETWLDIVTPELLPLLDTADDDTRRIKQQIAELVEHLPRSMPPLHAVDHVRSGALAAAGPAAATEVAAIRREADERKAALELHVKMLREADSSRPKGYRTVGFVWESAGLAIAWLAAVATGVMARAIGADSIAIGTGAAVAGSVALFTAVVCTLLERRRAASLVISVREGAYAIYAVLALLWVIGLVTTAVRVLRHDEVLDVRGYAGSVAWASALVLVIALVIRSLRTDRLDRENPPVVQADPVQEQHTAGLVAMNERVREREMRVFTALPAAAQDAVLAGELEGIRLLMADRALRPLWVRSAVLDVRDRRHAGSGEAPDADERSSGC